ncbi:thiamine pyrophosphate-binding protein [Hoeflea sp. WL0058]|uniref:Thiamine pyrophosphate-binding protein n=1 Tax=Flavimaribacter sediminis TaxID=2865987 RepID=A0AAE2ZGJ0_9HYPH|nr:thiamine pyrophosphate-binding protein [Flavimaribacter sediminis]MBW8636168.1 thiamine pyrophosphate-binding protein [Flavimaribacter sediminis]
METVADALVSTLREFGARYVFGVSGANIEHIHDSLYRLGQNRLNSVLCKTETGAAFMADGYARQTGSIGVCCATSGGGAVNLAVGVAEARASGVPVLALVGCPPKSLQGRGAFQQAEGGGNQVDGEKMWRSVAKRVSVLKVEDFWPNLRSTLIAMLSGHPGPAVLLIPRDTMEEFVPPCPAGKLHRFCAQIRESVHSTYPVPLMPSAMFRSAWLEAKRPVVIAGAGIANSAQLTEWAEREQVPVATTLEAPSAFPQTNSQFLGMVGVAGHPTCHDYIERSDCILALGTSLDIMARAPIESAAREKPVCIVHTNLQALPDWSRLVAIEECPKRWLAQDFLSTDGDSSRLRDWPEPRPFERSVVRETERTDASGLGNTQAVEAMQSHLHAFDIVMMDAGNCAATAAHHLRFPAGVHSQITLGMGGMGYAVCAGIGAQLARHDQRTLVLCGDGAMLTTGMELHTAIELGLPILWVIFNDSQHGMCTTRQRKLFDGRIHATRYSQVDFVTMVSGLAGDNQIWLARADSQAAVSRRLQEYLQIEPRVPGMLELEISTEEVPPFFPFMSAESPKRERQVVERTLA